ncbi:hypothetical protein K2173_016161 [Erythroxylum novogranatense]|uniref:Syntaxin 6/10/61 N-terminal domain-containing protein n=1 Tax=Erythroxylum novogranatense TaxID=1862640 RepID=A0AAV8SG22_9ROSI|nr:hypothetical protein K2173_016161 [Erythroxylum novogranatense]
MFAYGDFRTLFGIFGLTVLSCGFVLLLVPAVRLIRMESTFRMWIKEKREGSKADLDELSRDLQIALGTAKWQLEEFEKAVRLSHGYRSDDITASRHKQFIAAIENQILCVETSLRETSSEEGKQPLRWVNLDKEECDDLAMFLSGTSQTSESVADNSALYRSSKKHSLPETILRRKDTDSTHSALCSRDTSVEDDIIDFSSCNRNGEVIIDIEPKDSPTMRDDLSGHTDKAIGTRRAWSSQNFGALKVVVADADEQKNNLLPVTEATPKEKGSKPLFWKQRCAEHPQTKGGKFAFSQDGVLQRRWQGSSHPRLSCSIQFALALLISIFLIVPFLLYSS